MTGIAEILTRLECVECSLDEIEVSLRQMCLDEESVSLRRLLTTRDFEEAERQLANDANMRMWVSHDYANDNVLWIVYIFCLSCGLHALSLVLKDLTSRLE